MGILFDLLADVLFDALIPLRWRNRNGEVDARWFLLGFLLVAGAVVALFFGALYLLGVH